MAYALAGTVDVDLWSDPIGEDHEGRPVYLKDVWPTYEEITEHLEAAMNPETFRRMYQGIEASNESWNEIPVRGGELFDWKDESTYIQEPPFFQGMDRDVAPIRPIEGARVLVKVGDSVTTDHISPAGAIAPDTPAGRYLIDHDVVQKDFNSYGSRRGNDRVMTRGTFANIRLKNQLAPGTEGGWTTDFEDGEVKFIYDAAQSYQAEGIPTIVLAGHDYGMGSSRDWAAKGTFLLGVRAVIAASFERIHRSNLIGMGVLPLQFREGEDADSLGLDGTETFRVEVDDDVRPRQDVPVVATREDGSEVRFTSACRLDSPVEIAYYRNGGILHTVLRRLFQEARATQA